LTPSARAGSTGRAHFESGCAEVALSTHHRSRIVLLAVGIPVVFANCQGGSVTPLTTLVGKSVGTVVQTTGVALACGGTLAPDPVARFDAMPPSNKLYPFAGFELFKAPMCTQARLDMYRAIVTFNVGASSVAALKGLVQRAELLVETRALPAGAGGSATFPGTLNVFCPAMFGGAGSLQRFGPAAAGTLASFVAPTGRLTVIPDTDPFPSGTLVYAFPSSLPSTGSAPFPVPNATSPTTMSASGQGGVVLVTDVTGAVNAALNGGATEMSWMLTSLFEGPVPGPLPTGGGLDCRTSYELSLRLTHL
jgi:hypothetical protein